MRNLFIVAAKLFGVLQIFSVIGNLGQLVVAFGLLDTTMGSRLYASAVASFALLIVSIGLSCLLLFGTGWLADRLGIPSEGVNVRLDRESGLLLGVQLIGVYTLTWAIPSLIRSFAGRRTQLFEHEKTFDWHNWLVPALEVAIALFLMLKSEVVLAWLTRRHGMEVVDDEPSPAGESGPSIFE